MEMSARVSVIACGLSQPLRSTVMVTRESTGPRSFETASLRSMLTVDSSPIFLIWSSFLMPARNAGVLGSTFTTVRLPSFIWMTKPRPPNSPLVVSFISRYISGRSSTECGSSVESMPLTAAYSMSRVSSTGRMFFEMKSKTSLSVKDIFHSESTWLMSNSLACR